MNRFTSLFTTFAMFCLFSCTISNLPIEQEADSSSGLEASLSSTQADPLSPSESSVAVDSQCNESSYYDTTEGFERKYKYQGITQLDSWNWSFEYFNLELHSGCSCYIEWKSYRDGELIEETSGIYSYKLGYHLHLEYDDSVYIFIDGRKAKDPFSTQIGTITNDGIFFGQPGGALVQDEDGNYGSVNLRLIRDNYSLVL